MPRVVLQVVAHFGVRGECAQRHRPTRQARVLRSRKQTQRVPAMTPGVADAGLGIEYHELFTLALQVISDRKASLAATDDHSRNRFGAVGLILNEMHA